MPNDCIFCKIAAGEIPVDSVYEDEHVIAFPDIKPVAPIHVLVIPKKHIANLQEAKPEDQNLIGHIMAVIPRIAAAMNVAAEGFRVVINTGQNGGQTVYHLHCHMLAGRFMTWPPG